ncbi:hypothetical protein O181_007090 [Austropuccinia psidii MF-1]|uniref:Integrase catalytic domain-containing protein n=1 Tax=Austropuccinia psidii MF-1 TaxID=1389203 RepID=A0A9Q3BLP4_9BASI|nr:hypothetical protein [Austropuccinia psidii MF-1]
MVSDILGPFDGNHNGFCYILTLRDHMFTFTFACPLKLRSDAPAAIQSSISLIHVQLGCYLKVLCTEKAREFFAQQFTNEMRELGISLVSVLPYSPAQNSKAKKANQMLGDMAREMMHASPVPLFLWKCKNTSLFAALFGRVASVMAIYPFGAEALVHLPAERQVSKMDRRAVECYLINELPGLARWLFLDIENG